MFYNIFQIKVLYLHRIKKEILNQLSKTWEAQKDENYEDSKQI